MSISPKQTFLFFQIEIPLLSSNNEEKSRKGHILRSIVCPHAQQEGRMIHTEKAQEETASRPWLQYGASLWLPTKKERCFAECSEQRNKASPRDKGSHMD